MAKKKSTKATETSPEKKEPDVYLVQARTQLPHLRAVRSRTAKDEAFSIAKATAVEHTVPVWIWAGEEIFLIDSNGDHWHTMSIHAAKALAIVPPQVPE